jgi:hypothetical protein
LHYFLPKYGPFDSISEINAPRLTDLKQKQHRPHVNLNLGRHPKASLDDEISVQCSWRNRGNPKSKLANLHPSQQQNGSNG